MAIKKSGAAVTRGKAKSAAKIVFKPSLNGSYRIRFKKEDSKVGFRVLMKGGMFHRVPEGFIIYPKHKELLKKEKVPFEIVKD